MRILVYGFGPYKNFRHNITERIIEALPVHPGLAKVVFPVRFERRRFVHVLKKHRPDRVIGLGQCSRRRIELERRAANRKRTRAAGPQQVIRANGPAWWDTTLPLRTGRKVGKSYDAGDYVCNYSMYVMLDYIAQKTPGVGFGFLHIPHDWPLQQAIRVVAGFVKDCNRGAKNPLPKARRGSKAARPSTA